MKTPDLCPTVLLPLEKIVPDFDFNTRSPIKDKEGETTYKDVDELAADMKTNGQMEAAQVRAGKNGNYHLIFGHRRFFAAKKLGWDKLKCEIVEASDEEAHLKNLAENMVRENLTPYEIARKCVFMKRTYQKTGAELAYFTGKTRSRVNNLVRYHETLSPKLLKLWAEGHPKMTEENLRRLAATKAHDEQHALWGEWTGEDRNDSDGKGEAGGGASTQKRRPTTTQLERALSATKKVKASPSRDAVISALRYALGDLKSIPGFYDPKAEERAKAEAKAAKDDEDENDDE